ncbi:hypothetical protein PLICRDRAFT_45761 [Plicaturopsis crispa FD-325 SS-3]|uniref:Ankyrin n=1 Tax=Plicaturopsis crispa FD-325 SS-3 TaxID=944288 RepID=A0A0C9SYA5_PLICR|nr:hypothetical protein PLICRDRAFT_45761 [Plicaturopsis crispa FD-325 SS-3]
MPSHPQEQTDVHQPTPPLPQETIDFAQRMFNAARTGDSTLLLAAIDAGLPVNLTNDQGNTLLMLASYTGHAPLVSALLARGADPDRLNDRAQSPLAGAVFKGFDDVVKALVNGGGGEGKGKGKKADPRKGSPTAIEAAHMFGRKDYLELLGAREGDVGVGVPTPPSMVGGEKA